MDLYLQGWAEIYAERFGGEGTIKLTVVHPTAAVPMLYNRFAAPFVFLVTGIPEAFKDYLVKTAVLEVLFVERGILVPHDYVMTLTNYNLRTDSDYLRGVAENSVRQSVQDLLFNVQSDTLRQIRVWIRANRDNVRSDLSDDEAWVLIRDSVKC